MGLRDLVSGFNLIPDFIDNFDDHVARELEEKTQRAHTQMVTNWQRGANAKGQPWEPLAPETIRRKGHADPLIETGEMIDSAGYEVDEDNLTASIYVEDEKMIYHEFGTERIPARPVLGPTYEVLVEDLDESIGEAVDASVESAGFGMRTNVNIDA